MSDEYHDSIPYSSFDSINHDQHVEEIKAAPHAIHAEQALLGAIILVNATWDHVADKISPHDFYRKEHQLLYQTIQELSEKDIPFDVVTMGDELDRLKRLEDTGGRAYIISLGRDTPSASNVLAYANIVREYSIRRQLIKIGTQIAASGFDPEERSSSELLDLAENSIVEIAEQDAKQKTGFESVQELSIKALDKIEKLFENEGSTTGVSSGFADFDEMTSGLQKSDLIIVAGRPSMGKTTFAMNIAESVAIENDKPVAVFSMEMPGDSLVMRMISSLGSIDQHRIRTGKLDPDEWTRVASSIAIINNSRLFIDDTAALTPTDLRARAKRLKREHNGLSLIVIDYLQLMQVHGSSENRTNEISTISRSLKALAKELEVPVIALSQLNRSLEQRNNKRPIMSDLRESGAIEQDADLIVFIYRDEVYDENSEHKGTAEIIIGKHRNGPIGTTRLTFTGKYTRFNDFAEDKPEYQQEEF